MLLRRPLGRILIGVTVALVVSKQTFADFHFQDIVEIYSNADGTIQFIEMRGTSNGQDLFQGHEFTAATNLNTFTFPSDLPNSSTANTSWIMATSGFGALPGAVTPDYIIPNNFFSVSGDTLTLVGGAFAPMTFESGDLPTDGVLSLNKDLSTGTNSPENFAGAPGSVNVPPLVPNDVFVDFGTTDPEFGTEVLPFDTLQEAIDAANANATINLEPGITTDTFSGVDAISKALTLVNNSPGGESVQIGGSAKRTEIRSGFRSKPVASTR